jgi:hypothetical protein
MGEVGTATIHRIRGARLDRKCDKPKRWKWLPGYFFIFVKVIRDRQNDQWSYYDFFLILLANRFNSAYYLLLDTGNWSGGETSIWLTFVECSGKRAKLSGSESSRTGLNSVVED